jgi:hypothetical protein
MSASERWERYQRAIKEGEMARSLGKPKSACPYKRSEWGLGPWWDMGWEQQRRAEDLGLAVPAPEALQEYET